MKIDVRREGDDIVVASGDAAIRIPLDAALDVVSAIIAAMGESDAVLDELVAFGVDIHVARQLANRCTLAQVRGWISYVAQAEGLRNPRGFLVSRLRAGEMPPSDSRRRFLGGEYADFIEG